MQVLTKEPWETYENVKICYFCKEKFENKYMKDEKYQSQRYIRFEINVSIQVDIEVLCIAYVI